MEHNKNAAAVRTVLIYYIAYSALYVGRLNFSVASAALKNAGALTKPQIGLIGSVFSLMYAAWKLPAGYLGDRVKPVYFISGGIAVSALANLLIGFFPNYYTILSMWALNAFGQSVVWGPTLKAINARFTKEKARYICSVFASSVAVGSVAGLYLSTRCVTVWGVSACFFIPSALLFSMAGVTAYISRKDAVLTDGARDEKHVSPWRLLTCASFTRILLPTAAHGLIRDNVSIWMALYFVDAYGIDISSIAGYIFFIPVFALAGRFAFPLLFRLFRGDERPVPALAFGVSAVCCGVLLVFDKNPLLSAVMLGVISAAVSLVNTELATVYPARFAGTGDVAFMSSAIDLAAYSGSGIGSLAFGALVEYCGYGSMFAVWGVLAAASIPLLLSALSVKQAPQI